MKNLLRKTSVPTAKEPLVRRMLASAMILACILTVLFTVACPTNADDTVAVTGVSLDQATLTVAVGATGTLKATVAPANATNKAVTWASSDATKATVINGVVTGVAQGSVTITVKTADGGKTATCAVTVTAAPIAATGVTLNKETLALLTGATETLTATVAPANATNKAVTWASSDATKATVSPAGLVTAVGAGTANITVTTADGGHTATCAVTITDPIRVTSITVNKTATSLTIGATETLTITIAPANATNKAVTWASSSTATATVTAAGVVTARAAGTATISITSVDVPTVKAECVVTVTAIGVTEVTLNKATTEIVIGDTETLTVTVLPAEATNKAVTWASNQPTIATVSAAGVVSALTVGTANITVTSVADTTKSATCVVTVLPIPVTGVTLDRTEAVLGINDTVTLVATVTPTSATNKSVIWSSADDTIATVEDGVVTAKGGGTVIITVKTVDGDFEATCSITVETGMGTANIILEVDTDKGNSLVVVGEAAATIYKEKDPAKVTFTITDLDEDLTATWYVDGKAVHIGPSFVASAFDFSEGEHSVRLTVVTSEGTYWSAPQSLAFTIERN